MHSTKDLLYIQTLAHANAKAQISEVRCVHVVCVDKNEEKLD